MLNNNSTPKSTPNARVLLPNMQFNLDNTFT